MSNFQLREQQPNTTINLSSGSTNTAPLSRLRTVTTFPKTSTTLPTKTVSTVNVTAIPPLIRTDVAATYPTQPHEKIEIYDDTPPTNSDAPSGVDLWLGAEDAGTGVADIDAGSQTLSDVYTDETPADVDSQMPSEPYADETPAAAPAGQVDSAQTSDEASTTTSASGMSEYLPWALGAVGIGASIFVAYRILRKP